MSDRLIHLAAEAFENFDVREYHKGQRVYQLKPNAPEWVKTLVINVSNGLSECPADNWILATIRNVLFYMMQGKNPMIGPSDNLHELAKWMAGDPFRVESASQEFSESDHESFFELLRHLQQDFIEEIVDSVERFLSDYCDHLEDVMAEERGEV